jgi:hypothetical protein
MEQGRFVDALQIAGWLLTVVGQVQVGMKAREGFITWVLANGVLIVLCALLALWWSIGMYLTNVLVCVWSFRRWCAGAPAVPTCVLPDAPDPHATTDMVRSVRPLHGWGQRARLLARRRGAVARPPCCRRVAAYRFARGVR